MNGKLREGRKKDKKRLRKSEGKEEGRQGRTN